MKDRHPVSDDGPPGPSQDPSTGRHTLGANCFHLLQLVKEQGTDGLVEKIIVAQESLGGFINVLVPGAYASLTKVDFKKLDRQIIRPVGVYGPKQALVPFMLDAGIIDTYTSTRLLSPTGHEFDSAVLSGIYAARAPNVDSQVILVVYWPEDETWNDRAPSSVKKNRVTFMRYLTKLTDQLCCVMNREVAEAIAWDIGAHAPKPERKPHEIAEGEDEDDLDRLFDFEVAKTKEQAEDVITRPGFHVPLSSHLTQPSTAHPSLSNNRYIQPQLLWGEIAQGLLSATKSEPRPTTSKFTNSFNQIGFETLCSEGVITLSNSLSSDSLNFVANGLSKRFPELAGSWKQNNEILETELRDMENAGNVEMESKRSQGVDDLRATLLAEAKRKARVLHPYCSFERDAVPPAEAVEANDVGDQITDRFDELVTLYPDVRSSFDKHFDDIKWKVPQKHFERLKFNLVLLRHSVQVSGPDNQDSLIEKILTDPHAAPSNPGKTLFNVVFGKIASFLSSSNEKDVEEQVRSMCKHISTEEFLREAVRSKEDIENPTFHQAVDQAVLAANTAYMKRVEDFVEEQVRNIQQVQLKVLQQQVNREIQIHRERRSRDIRQQLYDQLAALQSKDDTSTSGTTTIHEATPSYAASVRSTCGTWRVTVEQVTIAPPSCEYTITPFHLTSDDKQNLRLDPQFVPLPQWEIKRNSTSFVLKLDADVLFGYLLAGEKVLLVVDDHPDSIAIYLDRLTTVHSSIANGNGRKRVRKERIGNRLLIAFDEETRMLILYSQEKHSLHVFIFDESFVTLKTWTQAFDLTRWYDVSVAKSLCHLSFVTGKQEVLLVDSTGMARIFSLVSQQCLPASLQLPQVPAQVLPSPDGACFFAVFATEEQSAAVTAYHWATFGSTEGIPVGLGSNFGAHASLALTSFVLRSRVHLLHLNWEEMACHSIALDISKKETEFMFQDKNGPIRQATHQIQTVRNSLLDCFADVWTRFPVLPAVPRDKMFTLPRASKQITFASPFDNLPCQSYFKRMIDQFQHRTRKPTGTELQAMSVRSTTSADALSDLRNTTFLNDRISNFLAGEWLVHLLCLIPIHIAVTKDNRFVPLKDGVVSNEFERSLLGAEVSTVVDSISLGWYESILQSYMATKPVKVVSSMGEQSVGKSYTLNHLVDTSFAGSAMRTTEGVWMSITPSDDTLLVALDFEGVHSIERSAQEDALLVLFNTAISNMVLFRNNFALSRDIAGLFQSFQSSATVFDPAANPTLFKSTLAIIIKDVVDSDALEIVREFTLKFQSIVAQEQEANFISRLHSGKLKIIPWPVIESKRFYTLFSSLKRALDEQPITHPNAGAFLHTLKTLMAKLKTNDWKSMSQTLASHRAHQIMELLPNALAFGMSEAPPDSEPLKDLDTDTEIVTNDTQGRFYLSSPASLLDDPERNRRLEALCTTWDDFNLRVDLEDSVWMAGLAAHVQRLTDRRVTHVQAWVSLNTSNFPTSQPAISGLHRTIDAMIIDLRENARLCQQKCASCNLACLLPARHSITDLHDCGTPHKCSKQCIYVDEDHADGGSICGFPAGHSGNHVCSIDNHLCGQPCELHGRKGCLELCSEPQDHSDDGGVHRCPSRSHACGEPCGLVVNADNGSDVAYKCTGTCTTDVSVEHDVHLCDVRMCPMACQLCRRLCASSNHLHGLEDDVAHLCGEEHPCHSTCTSQGICEIDTMPQSIEATFTGRHESFQYTKYSQVARRLPCAISIPRFATEHQGRHCHTTDSSVFHFCEDKCAYCGYFCTLPRGHSQQEHETSHGSMSRTQWVLETNGSDAIEINGHKFGSSDEGAPMMCNLYCKDMGRHVHIDFCRSDNPAQCSEKDTHHISERMQPDPDQPKDWITHELYWKRSGFKDPYPKENRDIFAKCDSMCSGPEHTTRPDGTSQPSFCTLPMFHPPQRTDQLVGLGYVSNDGHMFSCKNPVVLQQAFHVIFVIDRSGSMGYNDRRPLQGTPVSAQIARHHDDRLGAVYSSIYAFWTSRQAASTSNQSSSSQTNGRRRDSYSMILFDHEVARCLENDFFSLPDQLLARVLPHSARGGTAYDLALQEAQSVMTRHWSTERTPLVIFLSDGECGIADGEVRTFCRSAIAHGGSVSLQTVSFGQSNEILRRMAHIALETQQTATQNALQGAAGRVDSAFHQALDSVRLTETFLGIADSLKKTRGALFAH